MLITQNQITHQLSTNVNGPTESMLLANTDLDAIKAWLNLVCQSDRTLVSYKKEAGRFLLFLSSLSLSLKDVKVEDIGDYFELLKKPTEDWLIPKGGAVLATQCMKKGLADKSINYTRTVLKSMFGYLVDAQYLTANPFNLTRPIKLPDDDVTEKALSTDTWAFLWEWVVARDESPARTPDLAFKHARDRFMVALLYNTGMRLSSMTSSKMNAFFQKQVKGIRTWHVEFYIKGNRIHSVPVSDNLLNELVRYRRVLGLSDYPTPEESDPIIKPVKAKKGISDRGVEYAIEEMINDALAACEDQNIVQELSKVTPHSLRHTFATHSLLAGVTVQATQKALAHKNISTTAIYAKVLDEEMIDSAKARNDFSNQITE